MVHTPALQVIVGDTLFPGSCGRLDLPDSDVNAMFDSLARLRALDDATTVWPGHGYSGDSTTIRKEKVSGLLVPFKKEEFLRMF
jgi:glyoxylase-like metal-dependent hydrolase (beta-lactamase superfamily II)